MSHGLQRSRVQCCTICGWQQPEGAETVITCPDCGSTSFSGVNVR